MKPVLLDIGCIVALLDRDERFHLRCVEAVNDVSGALVTCEAVIAEACYLVREMRGAADAVLANVERGFFQIPFRLGGLVEGARALMKRHKDVPMDLADACLVQVANELRTGRILTLDRDFNIYRWQRNRSFELLIEVD